MKSAFVISLKKLFFVQGLTHTLVQVVPKKVLEVLYTKYFLETTELQLKLFLLIESPDIHYKSLKKQLECGLRGKMLWSNVQSYRSNVVESKETAIINRFFFIFCIGNTGFDNWHTFAYIHLPTCIGIQWPQPFLTTPTAIFFYQLLISCQGLIQK